MKRLVVPGTLAIAFLLASPALAAAPQTLQLKLDGIGTVSAPLQIVLLLTLVQFSLLRERGAK